MLSDKGNVLAQTPVQHIPSEEPRDTDVQYRIRDYRGSLEDVLRSKEFGSSLDVYESFTNDDEAGIYNCDTNKEGHQGPPDSYEIDEIIDNSDE